MAAAPRAGAGRLIDFAAAVCAGAGVPEAAARLIADTLVQADPKRIARAGDLGNGLPY